MPVNYADYTCAFCGCVFEELPFFGCCSRCYTLSADIQAVVDSVHPVSRNVFADAKYEALNAEDMR